ncbi:MAG: hypothetical protein J7K36_02375 [Archaeoglobaceae archaeon]|nr:hypothetical protein [Archaeoglobaceae archaeon]
MGKKMIPVYIEEDLYKRWRERFRGFSFSGWVQAQVMAAVDGLDFVVSQETERIKHLQESLRSGTLLTKTLEETAKKEREAKLELLEKSERLKELIKKWKKAHFSATVEQNRIAAEKAQKLKDTILKEFKLSVKDLVFLADKVATSEQNR